jgi:DNA-binding SARP family transcriptional activator
MSAPHRFEDTHGTEPGRGWRIELLGRLRAVAVSLCVTRFRTQKTAMLLAYLARHPHRAHSRETLAELLWPDEEEEAGRHNLRNTLSALRRQLERPRLLAASDAVREADRLPRGETEAANYDRTLAAARAALGEEALLATWSHGREMALQQAIQEALECR